MAISKAKGIIFKARYFGVIIGLIIFSVLIFVDYSTVLFESLEKLLLDGYFRIKAITSVKILKEGAIKYDFNPNVSQDIVIIGIDSNTLDRFGKWPFPRAVEANLLNTFTRITDQMKRERALFLDINFVEPDLKYPENDTLMIESINENGRVFLESFFQTIEYSKKITEEHTERQKILFNRCGTITFQQIVSGDWKKLQNWIAVEAPLKPYGEVAYKYGGVSTPADSDEVYRRQPLISRFSELVKEIYLDELTVNEQVNQKNFERLAWIDINGIFHDIPELSQDVLDLLAVQMSKFAPVKDLDLNRDGIIDESHYVIRKYKDYIIPAMPLTLALEYFGRTFENLEIEIGKSIKIKSPKRFDPNSNTWQPIINEYAKYSYPKILKGEDFNQLILNKINPNTTDEESVLSSFEQNLIFDAFILKKDLGEDALDGLHNVLFKKIKYPGITKIKDETILNEIVIPIKDSGEMLINFMGPRSTMASSGNRTFTVRPFYSYVKDPGPDKSNWRSTMGVTDKLLIVGMFATGLADEKPTPYGLMFGPEVMANALNTIIMNNFINQTPDWLNIIILLGIILFISVIATRLKTIWGLLISLIMIIGYLILVNLLFDYQYLLLNFSVPACGILFTFISIVVYRVMTEEKEKKKIKNMFGKYVSPTVVEDLLINPPELGGVDKELTVFFSDIRGFTSLSERMTPQALVNHLNTYLTAMTDLILEYKGTLDKYVGDAIMCFWGAPLPQEEHAILACQCAVKQMEVLRKLNEGWPPEKRIDIGIGLNSGIMTVGNMGSMGRMNYTLMGDNVNLGARLEGTNKQYLTNIIISEYTYGLVKDRVVVRELDNIRVKGKNKPVLIYELLDVI